jgi:glyoxylase I family protein
MAKAITKPKLTATGIDHVVLHVADVQRAKAFYMDVFGMTVHHDSPRHVFLRCGAQLFALFEMGRRGETGRDLNHIAFSMATPYDEVRAGLKARGIAVSGRSDDERCIYFEDPDGHQLQIVTANGA